MLFYLYYFVAKTKEGAEIKRTFPNPPVITRKLYFMLCGDITVTTFDYSVK
jgi:hypothetical protein